MKIPFYFRNKNQYAKAEELVREVNSQISKKVGWNASSWVTLWTKYTKNNPVFYQMPKRKITDKKYVAVLHFNKEKIERLDVDLKKVLTDAGYELINGKDNTPKYTGETTTKDIVVDSYDEFRAIASELNKGFGFGNWSFSGPKGMQKIIKSVSQSKENNNRFFLSYLAKYKDGVPVKIIVNEPDANIKKYIFKVKLKT